MNQRDIHSTSHTPPASGANGAGAYFQQLRQLLALELKEEREAFARKLEARGAGLGSVVCEPDCRYPVDVKPGGYNVAGQPLADLRFEVADDEVDLEFEPGKPATFFRLAPGGASALPWQCYVERVAEGLVTVSLPGRQAAQSLAAMSGSIGVQLGVDNTSFRVMDEALHAMERTTNPRSAALRDVLIGLRKPSFHPMPQMSFPWLNQSQQQAIQRAVEAQEVSIVHGPPGTGKTTTLVEAIVETLHREAQVLVCAPSNAAVDWISQQLMMRGIHVLRIGNPLRMSGEMLDCGYERRYAAHPDYHELWSLRRRLREGVDSRQAAALHKREQELELRIETDLFEQASVVSCTLIGSAYRIMERRRFSTLFIDEAAQALEPACWAAIAHADRVVMGGDHQQLPPTVKSAAAARGGLATTLMQRVAALHPQCVSLLDTQYRMNEAIMAFPSRWFYGSRLKAAPEAASRLVSPLDTPLVWVDTSAADTTAERRGRSGSLSNADEARLVIRTLRSYVEMLGMRKIEDERTDFAIITPYRSQARLIRRLLRLQHFFRTLRRQITVGTVDGFQGQERDVVLISLVRSNADGQIGFLRDLRRMNVAMTRARMKLIIVGDTATLGRHRFYRSLIEHTERHGLIVSAKAEEKSPRQNES
ncbi:MAG: AAA family ATPase [Bacteroidales bacterium]|nr:AAA family ATPase [Bacteroidales bacterium]